MNDNSFQFVLVLAVVNLVIVVDAVSGVGKNVDRFGEGAEGIQFEFLHRLKVELESFEGHNQDLGQGFQADSLDCLDFSVASFAEIGIIAFQDLSLYEFLQRLFQRLLILDFQAN